MATYRIENDQILIAFDSIPAASVREEMKRGRRFSWDPYRNVWHGALNAENEALAQRLTGAVPADLSLEEKVRTCLETPASEAREQLEDSLMGAAGEEFDEYLDFIHRIAAEEKSVQARIDECESRIRDEKSGYESQMKALAGKRALAEKAVASYLNSIGEERLRGRLYNVSIKETYSYKLDAAFEEKLKSLIAPALPKWIDVEFKIRKEVKQMDPRPEEIVVGKTRQTVSVWSDDETEPGLSKKELDLLAFRQGKGIQAIADERGVERSTVYKNLKECLNDGSLNIRDFVDQSTLDEIAALKNQDWEMKTNDIVRKLGNRVSYDLVSLSLCSLGLTRQ